VPKPAESSPSDEDGIAATKPIAAALLSNSLLFIMQLLNLGINSTSGPCSSAGQPINIDPVDVRNHVQDENERQQAPGDASPPSRANVRYAGNQCHSTAKSVPVSHLSLIGWRSYEQKLHRNPELHALRARPLAEW